MHQKNQKHIFFLGDSLTYGYMVHPSYSYPAIIERKLRERKIINSDVVITKVGIPGDTTGLALERLEYQLRLHKPAIVGVIYLGANDFFYEIPTKETLENFRKIIKLFYQYNSEIKLFLIEFDPIFEPRKSEYQNMYQKLKQEYKDLELIPDVLREIVQNPSLTLGDRIHPNEKGYILMAEKIYPYIEKSLRK